MSGVRAVLTYENLRPLLTRDRIGLALPSAYLRFDVDPFMLVKDEASYVGEPIALVVAQSRALAEDAAAAVAVGYEALPAVVDVVAALKPGSPGLDGLSWTTSSQRPSSNTVIRRPLSPAPNTFFPRNSRSIRAVDTLSKGAA